MQRTNEQDRVKDAINDFRKKHKNKDASNIKEEYEKTISIIRKTSVLDESKKKYFCDFILNLALELDPHFLEHEQKSYANPTATKALSTEFSDNDFMLRLEHILFEIENDNYDLHKLVEIIIANNDSMDAGRKSMFVMEIFNVLYEKKKHVSHDKQDTITKLLSDIIQSIDKFIVQSLIRDEMNTTSNLKPAPYEWFINLRVLLYSVIDCENQTPMRYAVEFKKAHYCYHNGEMDSVEKYLDETEYSCDLYKALLEKRIQHISNPSPSNNQALPNPTQNKNTIDMQFLIGIKTKYESMFETVKTFYKNQQYVEALSLYKSIYCYLNKQLAKLEQPNLPDADRATLDTYIKNIHDVFFNFLINAMNAPPKLTNHLNQRKKYLTYQITTKELFKLAITTLESNLIPKSAKKENKLKTPQNVEISYYCQLLVDFYRRLNECHFLSFPITDEVNRSKAATDLLNAQKAYQAQQYAQATQHINDALQYVNTDAFTLMKERILNPLKEEKLNDPMKEEKLDDPKLTEKQRQTNYNILLQKEDHEESKQLKKINAIAEKTDQAKKAAIAKKADDEKNRQAEKLAKQEAERKKAAEKAKQEADRKQLQKENQKKREAEIEEEKRITTEKRSQAQKNARILVSSRVAIFKAIPKRRIKIPDEVKEILSTFKKAGYQAYLCGSAVMNLVAKYYEHLDLNSNCINDYDIVTDAPPDIIQKLFPNYKLQKLLLEAKKIYSFSNKKGTRPIDITHSPELSKSLKDDAEKRYLTIKAIYADELGIIHDPANGVNDLKNGILRLNQNCPIQILQTIATAGKTGFKIPDDIDKAIQDNVGSLDPELAKAWSARLYDGSAGKGLSVIHELLKKYRIFEDKTNLSAPAYRF